MHGLPHKPLGAPMVPSPAAIHGRDAGLVRGVGLVGLAAGIVNGVVGAGIFALPSSMARETGHAAVLAYLACAAALLPVVLCFAEAGSRVPTSGGPYGVVEAAFGRTAGAVAGSLLWGAAVMAAGGIAAAFADTAAAGLPVFGAPLPRALLIAGGVGAIAAINLRGVRTAARVMTAATAIKLLPLLFFLALGAAALPWVLPHPAAAAGVPGGFARAVILALFAFSGMETVLGASGEVARPARTVPRALFAAMGFILVLYVLVQLVAEGLLGGALPHSATPLADAAGLVWGPGRTVLLAGTGLSMLVWLASDGLGAPRFLFALARDGLLPAALGRLSSRTHVPSRAIAVHASLTVVLGVSGSFEPFAALSGLTGAALYLLVCAAAFVLHRRGEARAGRPLGLPFVPALSALGVLSMLALIVLGRPVEIAGLALTIGVGLALSLLSRRRP